MAATYIKLQDMKGRRSLRFPSFQISALHSLVVSTFVISFIFSKCKYSQRRGFAFLLIFPRWPVVSCLQNGRRGRHRVSAPQSFRYFPLGVWLMLNWIDCSITGVETYEIRANRPLEIDSSPLDRCPLPISTSMWNGEKRQFSIFQWTESNSIRFHWKMNFSTNSFNNTSAGSGEIWHMKCCI